MAKKVCRKGKSGCSMITEDVARIQETRQRYVPARMVGQSRFESLCWPGMARVSPLETFGNTQRGEA